MKSYLKNVLHQEIPLSHAIGIDVLSESPSLVRLVAPLANNVNHKSTAFGGSLYCVAVLSCWALVHLQLKSKNIQADIVIQDGSMNYIMPVSGEIVAECVLKDNNVFDKAIVILQRKGRARIKLIASIKQAGKVAVVFEGRFVVLDNKK